MDVVEALILGIVQGATEYIPVSSTAHLLIVPWLFGWEQPSFAFNVLVQLGTLGAVILYLSKYGGLIDIVRSSLRGLLAGKPLIDEHARTGWMIVVATIPAVVFGLLFEDAVEAAMGDAHEVFIELGMNGLMLAGAEVLGRRQRAGGGGRPITFATAVLIGFGQALAIVPAISRSGATIAVGLTCGVDRSEAARFSFLMSIPVMLGAGLLKAKDLAEQPGLWEREGSGLLIAFGAAAVVGFVVIAWLQAFLKKHSLFGFAAWCLVVSALGLALRIG